MNPPLETLAIVGAGAAGLIAADLLQARYRITLFEYNDYLGGHTNTIVIPEGPDAGLAVDTGFIVLNDQNYPTLHRWFQKLGVGVRFSDMSFGYWCENTGLQYAGTTLNGLFAQRANLLNTNFLKTLWEIGRFSNQALRDLEEGRLLQRSLGEYLAQEKFSNEFAQHYLLPMGSAIWSASRQDMLGFPVEHFVRFFHHHGLLSLKNRPRWQTVLGGSQAYVRAFCQQFQGNIRLQSRIQSIQRTPEAVILRHQDGSTEAFDRMILATHADQALRLLHDPSPLEQKLLGAWSYQKNQTLLHTDASVLPPNRRAWASWNYHRESKSPEASPVIVTYHMNRLQGFQSSQEYCVTLNHPRPLDSRRIIREIEYTHPIFNLGAMATQSELPQLNRERTFFCGSYFGYGFHEDAVKSGLAVARLLGGNL